MVFKYEWPGSFSLAERLLDQIVERLVLDQRWRGVDSGRLLRACAARRLLEQRTGVRAHGLSPQGRGELLRGRQRVPRCQDAAVGSLPLEPVILYLTGFHSVVDLQRAINDYLAHHNADPKPVVWTASASSINKKVNRGKQAL